MAYIYAVPASGSITGLTCKTKTQSAGGDFTDLSVKNSTAAQIKVVLAGGGASGSLQNSGYYFTNTGTSNTLVTANGVPFTNQPVTTITSACYSSDGSTYALASNDYKLWVFNDLNV